MTNQQAINTISRQLLDSGLRPAGPVLVHSSLSSLGHVPGGPETVIRAFLQALGPTGTLLMPALTHISVTLENPVFDVRFTPSCIGAIPEYFRTRPNTIRSIAPTHSICGIGPLAPTLLKDHQLDHTPCGPNSPYYRLPQHQGQIVFLGCGPRPNTSMHGVEELHAPPYLIGPNVTYKVTLPDRTTTSLTCRRHNFGTYRQRYHRIVTYLDSDEYHQSKVLNAPVEILESAAVWEKASALLHEDPLFFVEPTTL